MVSNRLQMVRMRRCQEPGTNIPEEETFKICPYWIPPSTFTAIAIPANSSWVPCESAPLVHCNSVVNLSDMCAWSMRIMSRKWTLLPTLPRSSPVYWLVRGLSSITVPPSSGRRPLMWSSLKATTALQITVSTLEYEHHFVCPPHLFPCCIQTAPVQGAIHASSPTNVSWRPRNILKTQDTTSRSTPLRKKISNKHICCWRAVYTIWRRFICGCYCSIESFSHIGSLLFSPRPFKLPG